MNSFLLSGLLLATLFAVGWSSILCTPDQWEGSDGAIGGYTYGGKPGIVFEKNYISYDGKNQRKALFITYVNNNKMSKFQIVLRQDQKKVYTVSLSDGRCWVTILKGPFVGACIPDSAKKTGDFYLGLKGAGGLSMSGYEVKMKDITVVLTVSKSNGAAIPVGEMIYGTYKSTTFVHTIGYMDITPGIKNETVFDVPKECAADNSDMDEVVSEYLLRKRTLMGF